MTHAIKIYVAWCFVYFHIIIFIFFLDELICKMDLQVLFYNFFMLIGYSTVISKFFFCREIQFIKKPIYFSKNLKVIIKELSFWLLSKALGVSIDIEKSGIFPFYEFRVF